MIKNRKAYRDYFIEEELEAGVVLRGCEIKGREMWLTGSHIPEYPQASTHIPYEPGRRRKLLLHAQEIKRLTRQVQQKGVTIVPLKAYFTRGKVKLQIGLARGKRQYDKRETIKARDMKRGHARRIRS